MLLLAK
jgi:hypothetical protein